MKGLIHAVRFLTVFPAGGGKGGVAPSPSELAASMAWYPVVGALQGVCAVIVWFVLGGVLPAGVMAAVLLGVLTLTNGGFHLDGFADTVDGLAGGTTPEKRLEIMRDHTTGAVGVVFIVLLLIAKYAAIAGLPAEALPYVLVVFPAAGRWAMVPVSSWAPYARKGEGLGGAFSNNGPGVALSATIAVIVIAVLLTGLASLLVLGVVALFSFAATLFFRKKLGGVTGDVFGFVNECAELLFLLGAVVVC